MAIVADSAALLNTSSQGLSLQSNYGLMNDDESHEYILLNETTTNRPLNRYILDRVIQDVPVMETTCQKVTRVSAQGVATIVGMIGNLTFVNIAGEPARYEDSDEFNEPYRWTLIVSNAAGFGILTTWVLLKLVDQAVAQHSDAEKQIPKPEISKCAQISAKTAAIVGGIISQIPVAFVAYTYNDNSFAHAAIIVVSNASYPTYSLDLTFKSALKQRTFSSFEKRLQKIKTDLLQNLLKRKSEFLSMPLQKKLEFVDKVREIETSNELEESEKLTQYLELLLQSDNSITPESSSKCIKGVKVIAGVGGLFLSAMLLSHHWMGAYKGTEQFTNLMSQEDEEKYGEFIRQTVAAFVTGCNAYLTVGTIVNSVTSIFDTTTQVLRCKFKMPFSVQLMPKSTTVLKVVALGIAGTCWGASVQFSRDYFNEPFAKVVEYGASIANATLVNYAMQATIDEGVITYTAHYGKGQDRDIAKVLKGIDNVISKLNDSSMKNFAFGLRSWIGLLGDTLSTNLDITISELNAYLSEDFESVPLPATVD